MEKKYNHDGALLVYEDIGQGETVILIHGFAEDRQIWKNIYGGLVNYRVILPDLPGSGASQASADLSIESMAEAVASIIRHENIPKAIIVGHSMGGYITLAFVDKYPELVKAFGLFHSTAFADSEEKKNTRLKNMRFIESHGSYEFLKQAIPGLFSEPFKKEQPQAVTNLIEMYRSFPASSLISYSEAMRNRPARVKVLTNSTVPVLFIIGKHDNAIPYEDSLRLCHLPSLSYIHILENSGHMGMIEETDRCVEIMKNFLKDVTVPAPVNG